MEDLHLHVPDIEGQWAVAVLPKKKSATSFVGGSNWAILKNSKKKALAWKLIEFLSRPEIQVKWYQVTTDLPTRVEAWEDEYFKDKPLLKVFGQQLSDVKTPPRIQQWEEMAAKISTQMEKANYSKLTSEQALENMEKDVNEILMRKH
jgi:multiple sugar transport system substrate-binding protein